MAHSDVAMSVDAPLFFLQSPPDLLLASCRVRLLPFSFRTRRTARKAIHALSKNLPKENIKELSSIRSIMLALLVGTFFDRRIKTIKPIFTIIRTDLVHALSYRQHAFLNSLRSCSLACSPLSSSCCGGCAYGLCAYKTIAVKASLSLKMTSSFKTFGRNQTSSVCWMA